MRIRVALVSLFIVLVGFLQSSYSQEKDPYVPFAEEMPQPVGGISAIYKDIRYPQTARDAHLEGKVYLLAFINEKGHVDDVKVIKGIGLGCEQAAIEAIKHGKFNPAKNNGVPVKAKLTLAIDFKISG